MNPSSNSKIIIIIIILYLQYYIFYDYSSTFIILRTCFKYKYFYE